MNVNMSSVNGGYLCSIVIRLVNSFPPNAAYMRPCLTSALVDIIHCHLLGAKPLSYAGLLSLGTFFSGILNKIKIQKFSFTAYASESIVSEIVAILSRRRSAK